MKVFEKIIGVGVVLTKRHLITVGKKKRTLRSEVFG